jgi:mannosylglycerate hydrolase
MGRQVAVVAHTHWDREWYVPFESYRIRLAGLLDGLLPELENDPSYVSFLLDGQLALVDDYLAVRPTAAATIHRLTAQGRLEMGPWYVLMDEFCVSGETIIRNLQLGMRRAEEFGGAMRIGYLPDMFGHIAQMPQLLRLAGMEHAVVWRGVPAAVDRTGFWWEAPDGSVVRAEYLPVGYANGAFLPDDPDAFLRRMAAHEVELEAFLDDSTSLLLMNGSDHQLPQPRLPMLLAQANGRQDHFDFHQVSLPAYLAGAPTADLPRWIGELRSGARANVLMGVLSNRVDIKIGTAQAERDIESLAEPLAVLWLPADEWPGDVLDEAWLALIRNSAHDSICACSVDSVSRAVLHRLDVASTLAGDVVARALTRASLATDTPGPLVVNPGPVPADGVVETVLPEGGDISECQLLSRRPEAVEERTGLGRDLGRILGELTADGWLPDGRGVGVQISPTPGRLDLVIESDATRQAPSDVASAMAEAWAQAGASRHLPLRVTVRQQASQRILARVTGVPGFGWAALRPAALGPTAVRGGTWWLDNSVVRVEVDGADGTFSIDGLTGLDRLVDGGDDGDTYNYSAPAFDTIVDQPDAVTVELIERGPVRGILRISRRFTWPRAARNGHRVGQVPVEVVTDVEVHAADDLVRVSTRFDNPCRDHRLRAWFPLPYTADSTVAECAFAAVRRAAAEGGPHEPALATYPSRRFVAAGGLTLTHEGLLEHELVGDGTALAVTLLRASGVLARPAPTARPNAAGPALPLDGPQAIGPHHVRYGLCVGTSDPWRLADRAWLPLQVVSSTGTGRLPAAGSRLVVSGAEVSALHRVDGVIELRVYNPSENPTAVEIPGHSGWVVDLVGQPQRPWVERLPLGPWEIATARFDRPDVDP